MRRTGNEPDRKVEQAPMSSMRVDPTAAEPGGGSASRPMFRDHPHRDPAQAEIHARPISPVTAPTRIRRAAVLLGQDPRTVQQFRARVAAFCTASGIAIPGGDARRFDFVTTEHEVTWEFHTEFSTATWSSRSDDRDSWPSGIGLEACAQDGVVLAVRVDVVKAPVISPAALAGFDEQSLCFAAVEGGRAQVATDFLVNVERYTRYEIAAEALGPYRLGMLVRRLLEIETYRVLSLVSIGLARSEGAILGQLETGLATAMQDVGAGSDHSTNARLLDAVHALQLESVRSQERTRYRFAASHAYGDILMQRLRDLDERPQGDHWMLQTYLKQRIEPALATFKAIERRQTALLEQTARSTALLGTRISLDIDTQNRSILETISDTAKSQFKLQRTVEGLSTIAIAYYLLGIVSYATHVLPPDYGHVKDIAIAALAPVMVGAVWFYLRRGQKR
jgi:uncharacterized membrane-anchored protein